MGYPVRGHGWPSEFVPGSQTGPGRPAAPRPREGHGKAGRPIRFGRQEITTRVRMMVPRGGAIERVDVTAAMDEPTGPAGIGAPRTGFVSADMLTGAMHAGEEGP